MGGATTPPDTEETTMDTATTPGTFISPSGLEWTATTPLADSSAVRAYTSADRRYLAEWPDGTATIARWDVFGVPCERYPSFAAALADAGRHDPPTYRHRRTSCWQPRGDRA